MSNETTTTGCLCPGGTRHPDGETVVFREKLDFRTAMIARKSIAWMRSEDEATDVAEVLAMLSEFYLLHCIASWSLQDARGKPLEVSKANVQSQILDSDAAYELAEFADDLYSDRILAPLVATASTSSRRTPINGSTSATPGRGTSRKKPSTPSSITPSPMAATGRT